MPLLGSQEMSAGSTAPPTLRPSNSASPSTVAAGGGSILHFDGARFTVGPDSAGANPGPACYRRGGPLCVTDANVMTGKLDPAFFPKIFGPNQDEALDADAVRLSAELALADSIRWGATTVFDHHTSLDDSRMSSPSA